MQLLAESETGGALIGVLYSGIGAAAVFVVQQLWRLLEFRRSGAAVEEQKITDHLNKLVARLDAQNVEKEKRIDDLTKRVNRYGVRVATLLQHVRYLEGLLGEKKIGFDPYIEPQTEDDSDRGDKKNPTAEHAPYLQEG